MNADSAAAGPSVREGRVLVTGATGFIGTHLVRDLSRDGLRVRALVRDPAKTDRLPEGTEPWPGDLAEPDSLRGIADDIDVVFHLASAMTGDEETFRRVDVEGSERLLREARDAGVRRLVYASSLAIYPLADLEDGAVVGPSTPPDRPGRLASYARAKLAVERRVEEVAAVGGPEGIVLRPGLVFGPGSDPFLEHVPHLGKRRGDRYILFGDGTATLPLTYVGNTVRAFRLAASRPDAPGERFLIVDDDPPSQREYVRRLAALTGRPLRLVGVPEAASWLLGLGVEAAFHLLGRRPPTTRRLIRGKMASLSYDAGAAKRRLGWVPEVRWEEGLEEAVRWHQARGTADTPA